MKILDEHSHLSQLKKITANLCDRDITLKKAILNINEIICCSKSSPEEKIKSLKKIIDKIEWINHKTVGMNTQS